MPYELLRGKRPNVSYFHPFGCKCNVHNNGKDNLSKFDPRSEEGIFLGYSLSSRANRVYNKRTLVVEESIHVVFIDTNPHSEIVKTIDEEDLTGVTKMVQVPKSKVENSIPYKSQS